MCEQSEINYLDGEVVWVKLGSCWWPGEVVALEKLSDDVQRGFRKPPIACVKFFQEDAYEFVKNINNIYKYNCSRKNEFINKGLYMFRTKHGHMEKFPEDVIRAETAVGGDVEILTREEFQETKKESYAGLFGDPRKTPGSIKKGKSSRGRTPIESPNTCTPRRLMKEKSDYKVHILLQASKSKPTLERLPSEVSPSTSGTDLTSAQDKSQGESTSQIEDRQKIEHNTENKETVNFSIPLPTTPLRSPTLSTTPASSGIYACHACPFTTLRLNVLILHTKTHSVSFIPYTPSPVRKKPVAKASAKSTPNSFNTPKPRKQRKEKPDKPPKQVQAKKRTSEEKLLSVEVKKPKTDEEIKSSLLADWDDDVDDDSNDDSSTMVSAQSPEVPVGAESPAVPTPAELPSAQVPVEPSHVPDKKSNSTPSTEKPESSSDSKYEFCEDEDWPEEADFGRKIPRVKNPIRTEDPKAIAIDEEDVAREVADLLNKTTVPELPSVPEPLKIEENFPEPSIVKSPDKSTNLDKSIQLSEVEGPAPKAIFKTKTFFRSRHCRSQDAIGKYVAEQLNAVERMDISESDINGSEVVSSPEARDSPPIEPVKVARLAPKIQLKKMKAVAAQLREKELKCGGHASEAFTFGEMANISTPEPIKYHVPTNESFTSRLTVTESHENNKSNTGCSKPPLDVLYPTQEIKPLNAEIHRTFNAEVIKKQFSNKNAFVEEVLVEFGNETSNNGKEQQNVQQTYQLENEMRRQEKKSLKLKEGNEEAQCELPSNMETSTDEKDLSTHKEEIVRTGEETWHEELIRHEVVTPYKEEKSTRGENISSNKVRVLRHNEAIAFKEDSSTYKHKNEFIRHKEEATHTEETSKNEEEVISREQNDRIFENTSSYKESTPTFGEDSLSTKTEIFPGSHFENDSTTYEEVIQTPNFVPRQRNYEEEIKEQLHLHTEDKNLQEIPVNQESNKNDKQITIIKLPENLILEKELHLPKINDKTQSQIRPYMNESTASAVDALLSVSREADRVPRVVSNDLPEDLFEDDNKDTDSFDPSNLNNDFNEKIGTKSSTFTENGLIEHIQTVATQNIENKLEESEQSENMSNSEISHNEEVVVENLQILDHQINVEEVVTENVPSESDLQVAEALINLPSTAVPTKTPSEHNDSLIIPFSLEHEKSQESIEVPLSESVVLNETGIAGNEIIMETVTHLDEVPIADNDLNARFETEQEKSENLNAAQSLVQMSESIEHKINIPEPMDIPENVILNTKQNNGVDTIKNSVEQNIALLSPENNSTTVQPKSTTFEQSSSKLLKILEEPCKPKILINKSTPTKHLIMQEKDKILNFDVAKSSFKSKSPKQKIIIRRTGNLQTTPNKTVLNKVNDIARTEKIVLSCSTNSSQEGSSMLTCINPSEANTIVIKQKIREITKRAVIQPKLKIKPPLVSPVTSLVAPVNTIVAPVTSAAPVTSLVTPVTSLITPVNEVKTINKTQNNDDAMFDINSMPIVLSEDLLTPESIEKMPVVMSDGNVISQPQITTKVIKPKQKIEHEKVTITSAPHKKELKTLLLNPAAEVTKSITPNILSKSTKLRGSKPMLVIDKVTGKQKIIMTKSETAVKDVKQAPTIIQPAVTQAPKTEKFIILPTQSPSPRPARTQKIVIDPQTGKAHVFVAKGSDAPMNVTENKPVSAKLLSSTHEATAPGNTVMIITNAQGAQSRIVLTPEHEKILFPNKQQPNVTQLKNIAQRITTTSPAQKTVMTTIASARAPSIAPAKAPSIAPVKTPTRIVPKPKTSAIITSKGQLIVGGRMTTSAHNIAPMPEMRPASKRVVTSEPKKIMQTIQKTNSEPIIFLQQKSGAVMQLTAAQFEHLQRTGQIVQKTTAPVQEKIVIQKVKPATDPGPSTKPRARKSTNDSPAPTKKLKHEIAIAPAPPTIVPTVHIQPPILVPSATTAVSVASTSYSDFDNFEELLPSTAIARQQEPAQPTPPAPLPPAPLPPPTLPQPAAPPEPELEPTVAAPSNLVDGQLLAVPGDYFGVTPGTFYLCIDDNGQYHPIDNRPLVLENNQLVPMAVETAVPERRDILEAALANSDVFRAEPARDEGLDFRDLNANVSVHCRVSETSTTLNQPIMTPLEMPSKVTAEPARAAAVPPSLEAGLAVIGVTPHSVPTSLELPITVTDPRIAPKTTDPLSGNNYGASSLVSPGAPADPYEGVGGSISMPLLTDDDAVGKSMPILTDEVTASSLGSAGSPASEAEDCGAAGGWPRRLLTPSSDLSEASAEIPLQPGLQFKAAELDDRS